LDGAANLVIAADHRIEFPGGRALGQVDAVFFERLTILLGARVFHFGSAADLVDGLLDRRAGCPVRLEEPAQFTAVIAGGKDEQFARHELVAALLGELVCDIQQLVELIAEQHLAAGSLDLGDAVERPGQVRAQLGDLSAGFLEQRARGTALLIEQRGHQVHRLDVLVITAHGKRLGIGQGRLKFSRQLVHSHSKSLEITL